MPRDVRAVLPTRACPLVVATALTAGVLAQHDASKSFKLAFDVPQLHGLGRAAALLSAFTLRKAVDAPVSCSYRGIHAVINVDMDVGTFGGAPAPPGASEPEAIVVSMATFSPQRTTRGNGLP